MPLNITKQPITEGGFVAFPRVVTHLYVNKSLLQSFDGFVAQIIKLAAANCLLSLGPNYEISCLFYNSITTTYKQY